MTGVDGNTCEQALNDDCDYFYPIDRAQETMGKFFCPHLQWTNELPMTSTPMLLEDPGWESFMVTIAQKFSRRSPELTPPGNGLGYEIARKHTWETHSLASHVSFVIG